MATKIQRREKRLAARMRSKAKHQVMDDVEVEDDDDDNDLPIPELVGEPEPARKELFQKDYGMDIPMAGPTSWDEYEAMEVAREQADHVREVTWTVQDLVSNILYSSMTPAQKSKAIQEVGDGFGKKLQEAEQEIEKSIDDLDALEAEAILAKDLRHMSMGEKVGNWLSKAVLTAASESKLSDEDFALVYTDKEGKKVRKYPIHDKAHIRSALSYAAKLINSGETGAEDARKALPKIKAAAKKAGIGTVEKENSSIVVQKDATGKWRAVMWPSNNFKDFDGEIISESAHMEYVDWVDKNMDCAPVFLSWHTPGTMRKNRVDFVTYENGFLLMSAPLEEHEAANLLKAEKLTDLGMSHTSFALERDPKDMNVVTKYRMVEVSDLPLQNAANPFTDFETLVKEADMAGTIDKKAYLAEILGSEEEAEKYIRKAGLKKEALTDAGVENKEKEVETQTPEAEATPAPVATQALTVDAIAAQVFERITKEIDVEGLSDYLANLQKDAQKVNVLEELVKELAKDKNEKLAEMIEPPIAKQFTWQRASQSKETILKDNDEDEALKEAKPQLGWLSEATGTVPVQV